MSRAKPFAFVVLASVLFGTTGTAQAILNADASGFQVGVARQIVGGLALLIIVRLMNQQSILKYLRTPAGLFAAAGTLLYQITFFVGVSNLGVALGTVIALGSAPIFTMVLGRVFLKELITRMQLLVTFLVLVGIWFLVTKPDQSFQINLGLLAGLGAGLGYAIYTTSSKIMMTQGAQPTTAMTVAFAGPVPIALILFGLSDPSWILSQAGFATALYLGLIPTALAYIFFGIGLRTLTASTVATITLLEPVVASAFGVLLLNEVLSSTQAVGIVLVMLGLLILGIKSSKRKEEVVN